jgi:hypothetical protein
VSIYLDICEILSYDVIVDMTVIAWTLVLEGALFLWSLAKDDAEAFVRMGVRLEERTVL